MRRGQGEMTVEAGENDIALVLEWGKSEFLKKTDGIGWDCENTREGVVEDRLKELETTRCVEWEEVGEGMDSYRGYPEAVQDHD